MSRSGSLLTALLILTPRYLYSINLFVAILVLHVDRRGPLSYSDIELVS